MTPVFDQAMWDDIVAGYTFHDCAILREHGFCFVLLEDDTDDDIRPSTRFLVMGIDRPLEERFTYEESDVYGYTTVAASADPMGYVAVDTSSHVFAVDGVDMDEEDAIDEVLDMSTYGGRTGIIRRVVRVAGQIYALGNYRRIYRRLGVDQWRDLRSENTGLPMPADVEDGDIYSDGFGFNDMSAFSATDMYAAGGHGDVWRFDGEKWHNCPIPTKANLHTVCCAGDGTVYITELNGCVWRGRGDHWTKIADADLAAGCHPVDSFWFNGRLYLGAQQGIFTLSSDGKHVVPLKDVEEDAPNPTNGGRLDLSPDGRFLLTAGPYGACLHDGSGWRRLFSAFDFA